MAELWESRAQQAEKHVELLTDQITVLEQRPQQFHTPQQEEEPQPPRPEAPPPPPGGEASTLALQQKPKSRPEVKEMPKRDWTGYGSAGVGGGRKPADLRWMATIDHYMKDISIVVGGGVC